MFLPLNYLQISDVWCSFEYWLKLLKFLFHPCQWKALKIQIRNWKVKQTLNINKHHLYSHGNVTFTWNSLSNQWFKDCLSLTWEISEEARTLGLDFNELFLDYFFFKMSYLFTDFSFWPSWVLAAAQMFSSCRKQVLPSGWGAPASVLSVPTGSVALPHVGSSQTRDPARVPCIGRRIPYHWTTREVLFNYFLN